MKSVCTCPCHSREEYPCHSCCHGPVDALADALAEAVEAGDPQTGDDDGWITIIAHWPTIADAARAYKAARQP